MPPYSKLLVSSQSLLNQMEETSFSQLPLLYWRERDTGRDIQGGSRQLGKCAVRHSHLFSIKHKSNYPITIMPRYPQGDWFQDPAVPRFLGAHVSYIKCLSTVSLHTHGFCFQACMLSRFSHVWIFATPWTVAHQAPLSMGFSRQEDCCALFLGIFLTGIEPKFLRLLHLPLAPPGKPKYFHASPLENLIHLPHDRQGQLPLY